MNSNVKQFLVTFVVAVAAFAISVSTFASITPGDLVLNVVNRLEDDDFETGMDLGPGGTLDVGSILYGAYKIQALKVGATTIANDSTTTFTGIFALEVKTKSPGPGPFAWDFIPVSDATWAGIFDDYSVRQNSNTITAVFQNFNDPSYIDDLDQDSGSDYGAGTYLWEFGFLPPAVGDTIGDDPALGFWSAAAPSDAPLSLAEGEGDANLGLFLLDAASGPTFGLHDVQGFGSLYHLEGVGTFGRNATPSVGATLPLISDNDFFVRPVPEPATVSIWLLLGASTLLARKRCRTL